MIWERWRLGNCECLGARCEISRGDWQIVGLAPDGRTVIPVMPEQAERLALIFTPDGSEIFNLLIPVESVAEAVEVAARLVEGAPTD